MNKTALDVVLEIYERDGYVDYFEIFHSKYTLFYSGSYYAYVYETNDPDRDENEREITWDSFEEMLDDEIEEIGMTWREALLATPADKVVAG